MQLGTVMVRPVLRTWLISV